MNKIEFLRELHECLTGLPQEDMEKTLEYYSEMIDEMVEDGLTEAQAVKQIGTPEEIAKRIFSEIPMSKLIKSRIKSKRKLSGLGLALIITGSPIWASLLVVFVAVLFSVIVSVYAVVFSLVVSTYAVLVSLCAGVLGLGAGAICGVLYAFVASISLGLGQGLFFMGAGLFLAGVTILAFWGCNLLVKSVFKLTKWIFITHKNLLLKLKLRLSKGGKGNEN